MKLAIFDYGAGNILSLQIALEKQGSDVDVITSFVNVNNYAGLILPGVGNFDPAIRNIRDYSSVSFQDYVKDKLPVLGICLGMEMFFEKSEEGKEKGLAAIEGDVILLPNKFKIPHMGWNNLRIKKSNNSPRKEKKMVTVDTKNCTGCGGCVNLCPVFALSLGKDDKATVNTKCNDCGICVKACPVNCIK